jgi:hypothetical protein
MKNQTVEIKDGALSIHWSAPARLDRSRITDG